MNAYPVSIEVASDSGMFADPISGSEAVSYPFPSGSAAYGIITSVCRIVGVQIDIAAIATCSMPQWTKYTFNSRSPYRKGDTIAKDCACQIREMILYSPCFQILAFARNCGLLHPRWENNVNPAHSFQQQFERRLRKGQNFRSVSMGRKEFICSYVGPIVSQIEQGYNTVIPNMLYRMYDDQGNINPVFIQNVAIKNGVLEWISGVAVIKDGRLAFRE